jgi:hypothetical protein
MDHPVRLPEFRQDNPRDQLVAILSSLEGTLSNVAEGVSDFHAVKDRLVRDCTFAAYLAAHMPPGRWEETL